MESGEKLNGSELITIKEIAQITGMDEETAKREHAYIRRVLGFGSDDLMVEQYCGFTGRDYDEIVQFLNPYRPRPIFYFKNAISESSRNLKLTQNGSIINHK